MVNLWEQNCACIRQVIADSGVSPSAIAGVAVCGHGKGLYPWGKDGKPAYNGIISTDNRAWQYPEKGKRGRDFQRLVSPSVLADHGVSAGVAFGIYKDYNEAARVMVRILHRFLQTIKTAPCTAPSTKNMRRSARRWMRYGTG